MGEHFSGAGESGKIEDRMNTSLGVTDDKCFGQASHPSGRGGSRGDESDLPKRFFLTEALSRAGDAIPTEAQRDREIGLEVLRCLQNR
jgi:hypothetical protein